MYQAAGKGKILKEVDFSGIGGKTFDFSGVSLMSPQRKKNKPDGKGKPTEPTSQKYKNALKRQRKKSPPTANPHTR
jgi:hypothetical protein